MQSVQFVGNTPESPAGTIGPSARTTPAFKYVMPKRDFFAFCTSLKPIELRALGRLSRVEHLPAAETIYKPGDASDTLYIINRGVVELGADAASRPLAGTYLSRGDIFGEAEALTQLPRRQLARTCEPVSLQCFHHKDFAELLQRVPAFFQYLCEELACRLLEIREAAPAGNQRLELSGSLANFDLVTIYQTIVNSSQTGELSIHNDADELISTFFFQAGQPRAGQFEHLTGEEAFWQLFLAEEVPGTFSFSSGENVLTNTIQGGNITRSPGDMLINALQSRDEFQGLKSEMPEPSSVLERCKPHLTIDESVPAALRPLVEQIWRYCDKRRVSLRALYRHFGVCELKIYQGAYELLRSGHVAWSAELAAKVA